MVLDRVRALKRFPSLDGTRARFALFLVLIGLFPPIFIASCSRSEPRVLRMETTGYCGCGDCCGWSRGRARYLYLNFWNRYTKDGSGKLRKYTGRTASGTRPHTPAPGLFSYDSVVHPWMIPVRLVFFPWLLLPRDGTIAADTAYYPFGTRMYVPGWGWGVVRDRGGAIKGPHRLDLFFATHGQALRWGRRHVDVQIDRD
jgi:hypothetical protein